MRILNPSFDILSEFNREYILKRIDEIGQLENDIEELKLLISSERRIKTRIIKQLNEIANKYGMPRKTYIIDSAEISDEDTEEPIPDYPCEAFLSVEGYFKKCTLASLRGNDVQKFKENDSLRTKFVTKNNEEVLFFTSDAQVYKSRLDDFEDTKASALGREISSKRLHSANAQSSILTTLSGITISPPVALPSGVCL